MLLTNEMLRYLFGYVGCSWLAAVVIGYYWYWFVLDKSSKPSPKFTKKASVMVTDGLVEEKNDDKKCEAAGVQVETKKEVQLVQEVVFEMLIAPETKTEPVMSIEPELTVYSIEPEPVFEDVIHKIGEVAPDMETMLNPTKTYGEPESPEELDFTKDVTETGFDWSVADNCEKVNERKPMVFIGGVSASCSPLELVHELKNQGFNVPVLPRIRYGSSFGFCPDLVLSSKEELRRILSLGRVWVKDRWLDVRPYIPKEDKDSSAKGSMPGCNMDNSMEVHDVMSDSTVSSSHHSSLSSPEIIPQQQFFPMHSSPNPFIPYMIPTMPHQPQFPMYTHQLTETYPQIFYSDCLATSPGCYTQPIQQSFEAPLDLSM